MNVQKRFEKFTEVIGWIQKAASPFLAGLAIGTIVYVIQPDDIGLIIGISIAVLGLIVGSIWATKVWQKKGTVWFLSRIISTPDLGQKNNEPMKIVKEKNGNR